MDVEGGIEPVALVRIRTCQEFTVLINIDQELVVIEVVEHAVAVLIDNCDLVGHPVELYLSRHVVISKVDQRCRRRWVPHKEHAIRSRGVVGCDVERYVRQESSVIQLLGPVDGNERLAPIRVRVQLAVAPILIDDDRVARTAHTERGVHRRT